jgi:cytoskeletal protein CcmA (bactofilin family)
VGVRPGPGVLGLARANPAAKETPEAEPSTEGTLIVGEGIHVKGEIQSCEKLIVEGKVEASLEAAELTVRKGGVYNGKATVKSAMIDGHFDGALTVDGLLTIQAGGRVTGTLRYRDLRIEQGGRLSGDIDLLQEEAAKPKKPRQHDDAPEGRLVEGALAR